MDSPACAGCAHHLPVLAACVGLFAFRRLSSRAECVSSGLRLRSCIRLAADITLGLAPSRYILQSPCPAYLQLSLQVSPVSCSQRLNFGLAPSAALSGRVANEFQACAFGSSSPRTGDQLQLSSRAAHQLARNATFGLRRRPHACGSADDSISGLRQLSHPSAKLATSSRLSVGCLLPACAGCLPPLYVRSLSPSAESWLVFRLAPDPSSLALLSCDPESRRSLVLWACGLNPAACAAESLSQACGELSTSTGPCIVGCAADEYPASAVHCTSGSPAADLRALAFCLLRWLRQFCDVPACAGASFSGSAFRSVRRLSPAS